MKPHSFHIQRSHSLLRFFCKVGIGGLLCLWPLLSHAKTEPKIEAGLGVGSFQTPHYFGSNHYYQFTIPFPVFIYRFEFLEAGGSNRIFLFNSEVFELDLAFSGRPPVVSDEEDADAPDDADDPKAVLARLTNYTRRGMANIPIAVFYGLQMRFYLGDFWVLELPFLTGNTLAFESKHVGTTFSPTLSLELFDRESDHSWSFSVSWLHGNDNYNAFYYEVSEEDVLEDREAFTPENGLVSVNYGMSFSFDLTERWSVGGGYFVHDMHHSIVRDSPLVISPLSATFVIGMTYSFFQSSETVQLP